MLFTDHSLITAATTMKTRILTSSRDGYAYITMQLAGKWISEQAGPFLADVEKLDFYVYSLPQLQAFLAIRQGAVDLVDVETLAPMYTFEVALSALPATVRVLYSAQRAHQSGFRGLTSFSLAYTEYSTGACVIRTYSPRRESE